MTTQSSKLTNNWYNTEYGDGEMMGDRIGDAFPDVDFVDLSTIDGIPCVEFGFRSNRPVLTPGQILALGRRLKEIVDDYHPVKFQQARSHDVTFLVLHETMRDGRPFSNEQQTGYGTPIEEVAAAWAAESQAGLTTEVSVAARNAILQEAIDALPVGSLHAANAIRALIRS